MTTTTTQTRTLPAPVAFGFAIASMLAFFLAAGAPTPLLVIERQHWGFPAWLLTLAFGIYAITLLATLLIGGRLSDFIGRRPVLIGALLLETAAIVLMMAAGNIETIIVGRFLQGIATGAATSSFSSAVLELAPARARKVAASLVSAAPAGGLGLGALAAGALTNSVSDASTVIWGTLASVTIVGTIAIVLSPETVTIRPGARGSLRPSLAVPANVRGIFRTAIPTLAGAWMMAALFMGLVPTILGAVFHVQNTFVDGATSFLEPGSAAATVLLTTKLAPRTMLRMASSATVVGAALFLAGLTTRELWLIDAAGVVGGIGFGTAIGGTIRSTIPLAPSDRRAGVFAAIYAVSYLAFGVPAILAGIISGSVGLTPVVLALVAVIAAVAISGLVAAAVSVRRPVLASCVA